MTDTRDDGAGRALGTADDEAVGPGAMSAALTRFWWLVVAGAAVGIATAAWMLYELPSLTPRNAPVYSAAARLFVTSPDGKYVRLSVPRTVESPTDGQRRSGEGAFVVNEVPNVAPLLTAANLYPLIIEGDEVAELRKRKYGVLPGTVTASAYSAVSTPTRFLPAELPIIDVVATSPTPRDAIRLAQATADTFRIWVKRKQDRAGVAPRDRILIEQLRAPREVFQTGGPSLGIPILAALAIAAGFAIIAIVLDQLLPPHVTRRWLEPETELVPDSVEGETRPSAPSRW